MTCAVIEHLFLSSQYVSLAYGKRLQCRPGVGAVLVGAGAGVVLSSPTRWRTVLYLNCTQ